jgi:lipid-binding SYLF domain-containing protein
MQLIDIKVWIATCAVLMGAGVAHAAEDADAAADADPIAVYKRAIESRHFFDTAYGYAVFPTIGEGGLILGGAFGKGRVYVHEKLVGDATVKQLSAGLQAGGKAYSEIIFFEDKRSLDEFESGKFEFSAGASAIAITAAAGASVGTNGTQANASGTESNATAVGQYYKGMGVFTVAKGGLMYAAAIAGQKFSYKPRGAAE